MKLRNKLIPLASCLAIGATVAPMATACATSEFVDLKDGFVPTISKLAVEDYKLTQAKAEQVYFNAVSENPEVFAQDFNWTMSTLLRTAATNPDEILGDASTSTIDYAKQSVTNVKVGRTTINYTRRGETEAEDVEFFTISFDLVREQQFTWKYDDEVVSGQPAVQKTVVGTSMYKLSFNNVPINLSLKTQFESELAQSNSTSWRTYNGHLGRYIFTSNPHITNYISTKWFFSNAWAFDCESPFMVLSKMVDPWEVSYELTTNDTESYVYNDVAESSTYKSTYSGTYNDYEKVDPDDEGAQELLGIAIGSHYLADIKPVVEKE